MDERARCKSNSFTKPAGQLRPELDTARARERFSFAATTEFDEGLRRTIAWYETRQKGAVDHTDPPVRTFDVDHSAILNGQTGFPEDSQIHCGSQPFSDVSDCLRILFVSWG
jgi:hypothetical protein